MKYIWLGAFIGSIYAANWAIVTFGVVPVGFGLMAPAGVFMAGFAFVARDMTQEHWGFRWTLAAIIAGAVLSWWLEPVYAVASGTAFLVSECLNQFIYTPIRRRYGWTAGAVPSNAVGLTVDSVIFLMLAFGSLAFLPGQMLGKGYMTLAAVAVRIFCMRRLASSHQPASPGASEGGPSMETYNGDKS